MALDINAFRSIANQNPDKLVYVQGNSLKTTRNEAHHDAHTYKAATDAFLSAYRQHYGEALGDALKRHLEAEDNAGKPLTARKIKALCDFAEEKIGDKSSIKVGDSSFKIAEIGTEKLGSKGVFKSTKIANAQAGQRNAADATLAAFRCADGGKVNIESLLRSLNTLDTYIHRELSASKSRNRESDGIRLFEKNLFAALDAMDNATLSATYQGLISREVDVFKGELARILAHPDVEPAVQERAERAFASLSRLEAMIVSEVSRRVTLGQTPDNRKAEVPSLREKYCGGNTASSQNFGGGGDMTTTNLGIMSRVAAEGSSAAKQDAGKIDNSLQSRGLNNVETRKIGDMIRGNELTVNVKLGLLMGYGQDGGNPQPLLAQPGAELLNTYEVQEKNEAPNEGTGYLKHRNNVEKTFFPEYAQGGQIEGKNRPRYAAVNAAHFTSGAADTVNGTYGKAVVVLKPHVKKQCTYTLDDTFFVLRYKIPPEARNAILPGIAELCADRLTDKDAALAALRADEFVTNALDSFFAKLATSPDGICKEVAFDTFANNIASVLNRFRREDSPEFDAYDTKAFLSRNYMVKEGTGKKVATYDNIENLFAAEADFTAVNMAVATLRRQDNPNAPVKLQGASYFEAQIHGAIRLDRDVEEIRFDMEDIRLHFVNEFRKLPEAERAVILAASPNKAPHKVEAEWAAAKAEAEKARIADMARNAPFKVTFYDTLKVARTENSAVEQLTTQDRRTAVEYMRKEISDYAGAITAANRAEIVAAISRGLNENTTSGYRRVKELYGEDLSHLPAWFDTYIKSVAADALRVVGTGSVAVSDVPTFRTSVVSILVDKLVRVGDMAKVLDEVGENDPAVRERLYKQAAKNHLSNILAFRSFVQADIASRRALADIEGLAKETFEQDIEGGAGILAGVYNGLSPVGGVAKDKLANLVRTELNDVMSKAMRGEFGRRGVTADEIRARIRRDVVKPFVEKRTALLAPLKDVPFASPAERNAFFGWAVNAGKLKHFEEVAGVYKSSTRLADDLAALLRSGAPLSAKDLVAVYNDFNKVCLKAIRADVTVNYAGSMDEYGPDDRNTVFDRGVSVALSRLAARVSREDMARLAALMKSDAVQALFVAAHHAAAADAGPDNGEGRGEMGTFWVFASCLYRNLPAHSGVALSAPSAHKWSFGIIPPATRRLMRDINAHQARAISAQHAVPAPTFKPISELTNELRMPQTRDARKRFLVSMLGIYRDHERTFDRKTNYHGRTHATRAFIFGTAMANILKEKGAEVDVNAVALAAAGHDTGRAGNGADRPEWEAASADNTVKAVDAQFRDAAGDGWCEDLKNNVTAKDGPEGDKFRTIEGYLFKSADSLDYVRLGDMDKKFLPFLRDPLILPNGELLMPDEGLRDRLVAEAEKLSALTSPRVRITREANRMLMEIVTMRPGPERDAKQREMLELRKRGEQEEIAQTETLDDAQVVEMVENAIRENPADFPLLTKYYLNA